MWSRLPKSEQKEHDIRGRVLLLWLISNCMYDLRSVFGVVMARFAGDLRRFLRSFLLRMMPIRGGTENDWNAAGMPGS
jgi:hypothetical protein